MELGDRIIKCNMCNTEGTINDKYFIPISEGKPIPYIDYVICQNCGYKQLL